MLDSQRMETRKIVFLWSYVRSISNAFRRAFIQREYYITLAGVPDVGQETSIMKTSHVRKRQA